MSDDLSGDMLAPSWPNLVYTLLTQKLLIHDARERIPFTSVHRLGKKKLLSYAGATTEGRKPRSIIARVVNGEHKTEIMSRRKLLVSKPTDSPKSRATTIWINHDYPDHIRQARFVWAPVMRLAKQRDKSAYITGDKLSYNGKLYSLSDLPKLNFDTTHLSMTRANDYIAFYGRFSPLSNFYPVEMVIDSVPYNCVEQFYQAQRALFAHPQEIAAKILLAKDLVIMKQLGDQLKTINKDWYETEAIKVMQKGLAAKFSMANLREYLRQTKGRRIIEANIYDTFWSSGISTKYPEIQDIKSWPGKNILGELLMELHPKV